MALAERSAPRHGQLVPRIHMGVLPLFHAAVHTLVRAAAYAVVPSYDTHTGPLLAVCPHLPLAGHGGGVRPVRPAAAGG